MNLKKKKKEEQSHQLFHKKLMEKNSARKVCALQVYTNKGNSKSEVI